MNVEPQTVFKSTNGYAPTIREIGTALDIKSTCTVHAHLQMLKRFGYLSTGEGKARLLQVSGKSAGIA